MRIVRDPGRVAGLWYLLLIIIGPLRLIYIPNKLFVAGDATATVNNIATHEFLFRLGIFSELAGAVILIFLTLAFYRLLVSADRTLATLVVILGGVMPATLYFVGVVYDFGALLVARHADFLSVFDEPRRNALAVLFLKLRDAQNTAAEVLWGIWLFPLAMLVYRSRLVPRFLGVWLALGGAAWLALSVTGTLWPQYQGAAFKISQPATLSEIALTLWLLIRGTPSSIANQSVTELPIRGG
jgi:hypothetical protein